MFAMLNFRVLQRRVSFGGDFSEAFKLISQKQFGDI